MRDNDIPSGGYAFVKPLNQYSNCGLHETLVWKVMTASQYEEKVRTEMMNHILAYYLVEIGKQGSSRNLMDVIFHI